MKLICQLIDILLILGLGAEPQAPPDGGEREDGCRRRLHAQLPLRYAAPLGKGQCVE